MSGPWTGMPTRACFGIWTRPDMSAWLDQYALGELWGEKPVGCATMNSHPIHRALVLVEGQTEERFVKQVLTPHFLKHGLYIVRRCS